MNRNIITVADARGLGNKAPADRDKVLIHEGPRLGPADTATPERQAPKPDNYFDRLLKYVPAEMVSAYIVVSSPVPDTFAGGARNVAYWILLIAGMALTFIFARSVLKITRLGQLLMTVLAFVIFVASKGDAFQSLGWWKGYYASSAAVVFLILVAALRLPQLEETK